MIYEMSDGGDGTGACPATARIEGAAFDTHLARRLTDDRRSGVLVVGAWAGHQGVGVHGD
jgi:hypothetical protein